MQLPVATLILAGLALAPACTTGAGADQNLTDVAGVIRELDRRDFGSLRVRDVESIAPGGRW